MAGGWGGAGQVRGIISFAAAKLFALCLHSLRCGIVFTEVPQNFPQKHTTYSQL